MRAWLRERLATGPRPAAEMLAAAEANGISLFALKQARRVEGIVACKSRTANGGWAWSLPDPTGEEVEEVEEVEGDREGVGTTSSPPDPVPV